MILLIDNYDSFVFNLARYFRELGQDVSVVRNDRITITEVAAMQPAAIVLSPGPCTPNESGICVEVVRQLGSRIPLLGVCLGHQTIAAALGGEVVRAAEPFHGRTSLVEHDAQRLFAGLPNPLTATRYHSLIVSEAALPACLRPTARTLDDVLMAFEHTCWPTFGVQFHPESVLTTGGHRLLRNFLDLADITRPDALEAGELDRLEQSVRPMSDADDWEAVGPLHW
ncbi:MAG: aminodeoxychorismate/anthranilate synthase component II [Planctomycetes bacterium]|nr:aminodeoxychorismate/anthranilate synthase component II [Planctomycetota bacterium]